MDKKVTIVLIVCALIHGHQCHFKNKTFKPRNRTVSFGADCVRDCFVDPEPRVCLYNFTLELYTTNNVACDYCRPNKTNCVSDDCQCVPADGVERTIISTNRMLPGPAIYVCHYDEIVVDVTNSVVGEEMSIHWHGIEQRGTQYYDGVPFVTQCPIGESNTFRYQFLAALPGTYFWHSHSGISKLNGVYGSLIIRESNATDVQSVYYDCDKWEHTMLIQDWLHTMAEDVYPGHYRSQQGQVPNNILINGMGQYTNKSTGVTSNTSLAVFEVEQGYRYRFRLINAFGGQCAARLIFQDHDFLLIATDGNNIEPVKANNIISMAGERYDFVINATQPIGSYWIQLVGIGECAPDEIQQFAILRYKGAAKNSLESNPKPTYQNHLNYSVTINPLDGNCTNYRPDAYCLNHINDSRYDVDAHEILNTPDEDILCYYVPVDVYGIQNLQSYFAPGKYSQFQVGGGENGAGNVIGTVNAMSFVAPPSALISQYDQIPKEAFCDYNKCWNATCPCLCTNVMHIPLGTIVDMIIVDTVYVPNLFHPIHLHGYSFHVLAMGLAQQIDVEKITINDVIEARKNGKIPCRTNGYGGVPPRKDTIALPSNGFAIIRFKADNPGFWNMHCHIDYHLATGMMMVWQVGNLTDLPTVPKGFPTCGNFLPEINTAW